jgi:tRNA pseudouridine13 synthase
MLTRNSQVMDTGASLRLVVEADNGSVEIGRPIVKSRPGDFLVSESLVLPFCAETENAKFTYLRLTKIGFTTFEAVEAIANQFHLSTNQVGFGGLKDEDAITDQLIAVEGVVSEDSIESFNVHYHSDTERFMHLHRWGVGTEPIRVGQLNGNSFRLVVRNLSEHLASRFKATNKYTFHFLNYYDTQRFGISKQPKISHLIGQALIEEDFDVAFALFKEVGPAENEKARSFRGSQREFFSTLNPQLVKFLKDSYSSHLWNQSLASLVRSVCGDQVFEASFDDVPFTFATTQCDVLAVLKEKQSLDFVKFYDPSKEDLTRRKPRATVIQLQVLCNGSALDEDHSGAHKTEFSFFLPSGSYATMCIKQLLHCADFP